MAEDQRISRRTFIKGGVAAGTGLLFAAACSPKTVVVEKEVVKEKEVTRIVEQAPEEKPVVLRLHMRAGGEESEVPIYVTRPNEFTEETGIQVQLEPIPGGEFWAKIETLAASGTLGDNMFTSEKRWYHSRMVHFAILTPIDEYMNSEGISQDEWLPGAIGTCTFGGKVFGLPKCAHPGHAFVWLNHDLLEEAGIPIPDRFGTTWDDLKQWAQMLTKGPESRREVYGYYPTVNDIQAIVNGVRSFGGWVIDEEGKEALADTPAWQEYVRWNYDAWVTDKVSPYAAEFGSAGLVGMFAAGKVAMFHSARSTLKSVREAVGPEDSGTFKWSTIGLPEGPNFNKWGLSLNTHAGTSQSQHKLESFKLTYALSDARFAYLVANEIGYLVGRQNELDEIGDAKDDPFIQLQYEQQAKGTPYRIGRNYRGMEFEQVIMNTLDQAYLGAAEPTEAFMGELDDAMDDILERPLS